MEEVFAEGAVEESFSALWGLGEDDGDGAAGCAEYDGSAGEWEICGEARASAFEIGGESGGGGDVCELAAFGVEHFDCAEYAALDLGSFGGWFAGVCGGGGVWGSHALGDSG